MHEAYTWAAVENWDTIAEIGAALYVLLSLVVAATDTKEDDRWLAQIAQRLSFLAPKNANGTLSVPGRRPSSNEDTPEGPRGGPGRGTGGPGISGGSGVAVLLLSATALGFGGVAQGCGGAVQGGLSGGAQVLVQLSDDAVPFYDERDGVCRERHPPLPEDQAPELRSARRDEYDSCMSPVEAARTSRATLDRLLRSAQAAYDASGEEGFLPKVPCLLRTADQLLAAVAQLEAHIPQELLDLIAFLQSFTSTAECSSE